MKIIFKVVLLVEAMVGFSVLIYFWVLGLIMSPVMVLRLLVNAEFEMVFPVLAIVLGGVGLWGMLQLIVKVMAPGSRVAAPCRLLVYVVCGLLAVSVVAVFLRFDDNFFLIFLPPVLVTIHFMYLVREYLPQAWDF
jgi:hypothetical protein